jgi:hypothetical protein
MSLARFGGGFLIAGIAAVAASVLFGGTASAEALDPTSGTSGVTSALLPLLTIGCLALSVSWSEPFNGRLVRLGLRSFALGLLTVTFVTVAIASRTLQGPGVDVLLVPLVGGGLATLAGLAAASTGLARADGVGRYVGAVLLAGLLLVGFGTWARNGNPPVPAAVAVSGMGFIVLALGALALGLLGITTPLDREHGAA